MIWRFLTGLTSLDTSDVLVGSGGYSNHSSLIQSIFNSQTQRMVYPFLAGPKIFSGSV